MKSSKVLIICLLLSIPMLAQEIKKDNHDLSNHFPLPRVDKRVELLSIVFRIAGNWEYNDESYKLYTERIHSYFDKYKNHPLILFATEMRNKGVSFDAVMKMAIYLEQPPVLNPIIPFTSVVPEKRWGKEESNKFVKLLQQFYSDANCENFFIENEGLYKIAQENFIQVYEALDINWYSKYYGVQPKGSLNVILGLGNGGGNYGVKMTYPDGKEDAYAIMGTGTVDSIGKPFYKTENYLPTLIHEFNHSYVNYLTDNNIKGLENSGELLFDIVKDNLRRQSYGNWQTMMNEALVRASVIRYMLDHDYEKNTVRNQLITEFGNGFFWIKGLVGILGEFEKNRDKYPTLESYMPVIIEFYNGVARDSELMFEIKN